MKPRKFVLVPDDVPRIKKCIKHWERLRDGKHKEKEGEGPSGYDCALCEKYYDHCTITVESEFDEISYECPLAQAYGRCGPSRRNPWFKASNAFNATWGNFHGGTEPNKKQTAAMQAMIDALTSLLST